MSAEFRELTNLDVAFLIQELLPLVGARIEKAYQISQNEFIFRFKGGENKEKKDVVVLLPYAVMLTERSAREAGTEPQQTNLILFLRKYLENKVLISIEQMNFDRIIVFNFEESKVIIELFRKGNLILTDTNGKILALQRVENATNRITKAGANYVAPELSKVEPTIDEIRRVMENDWKDEKVVVVITRNVNFPALYLNELLTARGIDPKKRFDELTVKEKERISSEMHEFVKELTEDMKVILRPDGSYVLTDQDPKLDDKQFHSLSALLAELHASSKKDAKRVASGSATEKARNKLKHQEGRHLQLLKEAEEEKMKGEWIKSHAHEVEDIIGEYKKIKNNGNKDELNAFLKKHKARVGKNGIEMEIKE